MKIKVNYCYSFLLVVVPIICNYRIFPIPLLYAFFLLGLILCIDEVWNGGRASGINSGFLLFILCAIITSISVQIAGLDISLRVFVIRITLLVLFFINVFIYAFNVVDFEYIYKLYRNICLALTALIIFQYFLSLIGHPVSFIFPDLSVTTGDKLPTNFYRIQQVNSGRFSTFFLEPAHQAQYILPCLGLLLVYDAEDISYSKRLLFAIALSIGLVATTSMQGILGALIIWGYYAFTILKGRNKKKLQYLFLLIPIFIVGMYCLYQQPIIREQFQKKIMSLLDLNTGFNTSMYLRVKIGWDCYKDSNWIYKLFGCGYSNAGHYLTQTGIGYHYYADANQIGYMSGASKLFVEFGLIGVVLLVFGIIKQSILFKDKTINVIFLSWLILLFTSDCFDGWVTMLPLTFIFSRSLILRKSIYT